MKFYIEPSKDYYIASCGNVNIKGIGDNPLEAIESLKNKLEGALRNDNTLIEVGHQIIRQALTEINEWQQKKE